MTNNRKHEVKSWLYALLGVVVGATGAYFWMQDTAPTGETSTTTTARESGDAKQWTFSSSDYSFIEEEAKGMKPSDAHAFFKKYQGDNPAEPLGILRTVLRNGTTDTAALGMYLSKVNLFKKLEDTAKSRKIDLIGYYIVFAKEDDKQHRMLFMGVYKDGDDHRLMLPSNGDDDTCIYDWIRPCPEDCPKESESDKLWNLQNWMVPPQTTNSDAPDTTYSE